MGIEKKIHYCWFGGNQLPELVLKCIDSWKRVLPDYEIIEWNEGNFDINLCTYTREAYETKKYAFVSDYVRLHALYNYGGIYLDTDVEVIKSFNNFLEHEGFSGFENKTHITTGILAAQKGSNLIREFLDHYNNKKFILEDGSYDLTTNVDIFTKICTKHGFVPNNQYQVIQGFALYPQTYFSPLSDKSKKQDFSENTHAIHHFAGTWLTEKQRRRKNSNFWKVIIILLKLVKKVMVLFIGEQGFNNFKLKIKRRKIIK
ncbi:glycosyltransferase [Neobacillus novalis]|uniref:Glycosyltransferase n=1 Tax=Neobacillus novalis TaxID=220687 RepID=A0AA95MMR8_9BACI|nr:glycosyltransferase [Neobacillus novalis]WHY86072.1 glycosyltransferase [Neobacillus novalis]